MRRGRASAQCWHFHCTSAGSHIDGWLETRPIRYVIAAAALMTSAIPTSASESPHLCDAAVVGSLTEASVLNAVVGKDKCRGFASAPRVRVVEFVRSALVPSPWR